jgi:hypothetical protein
MKYVGSPWKLCDIPAQYKNYVFLLVCPFCRRCNLREVCHCAVSIRVGELAVTFDICSRGYLQVKDSYVETKQRLCTRN